MAKYFTESEMEQLSKNPYVEKVSESTITYTDSFRKIFIDRYNSGEFPAEIIRDCGFDLQILGRARVKSIKKRILKMSKRGDGVTDTRKSKSGRTSMSELTDRERIEFLETKIKYLEQENDFLKKTEYLDKQAQWRELRKQRQKKNTGSLKK